MSQWVFYWGGPRARKSSYGDWWEEGCLTAHEAGAVVPRSTYDSALPEKSQYENGLHGWNRTALLPVELPRRRLKRGER